MEDPEKLPNSHSINTDLDIDEGCDKSDKSLLGVSDGDVLSQKHLLEEGFRTCEYCGYIGRFESFFSKSKRFCSCVCSRSYSSSKRDKSNNIIKTFEKRKILFSKNVSKFANIYPNSTLIVDPTFQATDMFQIFDWGSYIDKENAVVAPVSCFKHCPLWDFWQNIVLDMKIEVINTDAEPSLNVVYWIASVKAIAGYKVKVRYEGYEDSSNDYWLHLCSEDIHPVGWCASNKQLLVPPRSIRYRKTDWKEFLLGVLTGAWTLPTNFREKVGMRSRDWPFQVGFNLEVADKNRLNLMRPATVVEMIGGRLKLRYEECDGTENFFCCHSLSNLIHPVGWSQTVGLEIQATEEYKSSSLSKARFFQYSSQDASPRLFKRMHDHYIGNNKQKVLPTDPTDSDISVAPTSKKTQFEVGMKLEAVYPLDLGKICVATVARILNDNENIIVSIDEWGVDMAVCECFCCSIHSPFILPVSFCKVNNIELTPPKGYKSNFEWYEYLQATRSKAVPVDLFDQDNIQHNFRKGMRLEAADLMNSKLVCVAMVVDVVGRLMKVHFDGWEDCYDQWFDVQSADVYPVGWCEIVGHRLEPPKSFTMDSEIPVSKSGKKKLKGQSMKGCRKPRKARPIVSPISLSDKPAATIHSPTSNVSQHGSMKSEDASQAEALLPESAIACQNDTPMHSQLDFLKEASDEGELTECSGASEQDLFKNAETRRTILDDISSSNDSKNHNGAGCGDVPIVPSDNTRNDVDECIGEGGGSGTEGGVFKTDDDNAAEDV